jgi:hypothetical protein
MGCPAQKVATGADFRPSVTLFFVIVLFALANGADCKTAIFSDPLPAHYRTQGRFAAALDRPISATWKGVGLRTILRRLSHEREIAILLDRRVDPEQGIEIDTGEQSLRSAVDGIARLANLSVTRIGNSLLVAPPAAALRLRTLVAIRDKELASSDVDSSDRMLQLRTQRATIRWDDLDRPADIVRGIARQFGLSLAGIEQIPHDLWTGAVIPEATAAEALSLVLNQFDLTFEWTNRGAGVRLIAVPASVTIERSYALHGKSAGETLRVLQSKIEGLDAEIRRGQLVVRGTVEQHEMVAAVLGLSKGSLRTNGKRPAIPLERLSFALQARGVNLPELFDELRKQGLKIQYKADDLRKAGVDLKQKVSVDLPHLPASQFFTRLLDPYGLTFHFDRSTVIVEPK